MVGAAPWASGARPGGRHNIPADLTSFVGRRREMRELRTLLGSARLVTLTGLGGVGKSRVARATAVAAARAFSDGVWLTDFAAVHDGRFVMQAVQDCAPGPASVLDLAEQLAGKEVLLLLDNCDRFTDAVGDLAIHLLARCPGVRILASSRAPLAVSAEHVFPLRPMLRDGDRDPGSGADAVALFRERTRAAAGVELDTGSDEEIARLCERLDGLPLAIELAALRTRTMTVRQIQERLDDRFGLLQGGPRDLHERHRSLSALLEWTWEQSSGDERSLWAQFSVFAGSATLEAMAQVCRSRTGARVDDAVQGLVQQSILSRSQSDDTLRFQMLDTVREFGQRQLDPDATAELRHRHLVYYAALTARTEREWFGPGQRHTSRVVTGEMPNLRAAFEFATADGDRLPAGAAMVADLWFYWLGCGRLKEGRLWSEHAWQRVHELGMPQEARALWALGWHFLITGDLGPAGARLRECLEQADRQGDARAGYFGRALVGALSAFQGDVERGAELYRAAISEARARQDHLATAMFLYQLGEAHCVYGEFDLAEASCRESIAICERHGDVWCRSYARWVLALTAFLRGERASSVELASLALHDMRTIDDQLGIALVGELVAWIAADEGRDDAAATLLGATDEYWTASGCSMMGLRQLVAIRTRRESTLRAKLGDIGFERTRAEGAARGHERIAELVLAQLPAVDPAPAAGASPAGPTPPPATASPTPAVREELTRREREIVRLVALGLTNREIAARLIIGKRTVDTHVAHVLTKWGVRRRSEIASLAASHPELS